jgi:hypothetical protein
MFFSMNPSVAPTSLACSKADSCKDRATSKAEGGEGGKAEGIPPDNEEPDGGDSGGEVWHKTPGGGAGNRDSRRTKWKTTANLGSSTSNTLINGCRRFSRGNFIRKKHKIHYKKILL